MNDHDHDRRLDESLRAAFAPPVAGVFAAMAQQAVGKPRRAPIWPWVMAAAALLVVAVLLATWPQRRGPEGHDGRELGALWAAAYGDAQARGFGDVGCCQPGLDLPKACRERFSCGLDLREDSKVALLGGYSGLPTGGCMALLARAGGVPLGVYVVPAANDPHVELPADSRLHLARRELGQLVVYALSPSSPAAALESFVVPQQ